MAVRFKNSFEKTDVVTIDLMDYFSGAKF